MAPERETGATSPLCEQKICLAAGYPHVVPLATAGVGDPGRRWPPRMSSHQASPDAHVLHPTPRTPPADQRFPQQSGGCGRCWRSWRGDGGGQGKLGRPGGERGGCPLHIERVPRTALEVVMTGQTNLTLLKLPAPSSLQERHKSSCASCELQHRLAPPAVAPRLLCTRLSPWRRKQAKIVNLCSVLWLAQPGGFPHL